jgi:RNA polymerase sigma-70 factor, ECF subfamily
VSEEAFDAARPRLLGIAYGLLGELTAAEDVVQDAWLRWERADRGAVEDPESFLVTVTTRLALDRLGSARARREVYVGPWLPEPLLTDPETPETKAIEAENLDLALLAALERLNPVERAVLVLRDAFDLDYAEIAAALDKSTANVRQIARRARSHAGDPSRGRAVGGEERERLANAFLAAAVSGDIDGLRDLLAADAIMYTDGGGVVVAARKPIYGRDKIARFMVGIQNKTAYPSDPEFTRLLVNGDPGVRMDSASQGFLSIVSVEIAGGAVRCVRFFNNPERFPASLREAATRSDTRHRPTPDSQTGWTDERGPATPKPHRQPR